MGLLIAFFAAVMQPVYALLSKQTKQPQWLNFLGMCLGSVFFVFLACGQLDWGGIYLHWKFIFIAEFFSILYIWSYLKLLQEHEFKTLFPLVKISPIILLFIEIAFLGTDFSWMIFLGVSFLSIGAAIFGFDYKLKTIRLRVFVWVFLVAFFSAMGYIGYQQLQQVFSTELIIALGVLQLPFLYGFVVFEKKSILKNNQSITPLSFRLIASYAVAMYLGFYLFVWALDFLPASYVASIRNLSILIGIFYGGKFLQEGHDLEKYIAGGLMLFGAGLLAFYG